MPRGRFQHVSHAPRRPVGAHTGTRPRETRARRLADQANARRDAVIGAAARARARLSARSTSGTINRPSARARRSKHHLRGRTTRPPPPRASPWMSPPRHRNRAGSAPATPLASDPSSLPVMRGGAGAARTSPRPRRRAGRLRRGRASPPPRNFARARRQPPPSPSPPRAPPASAPSTPARSRDVGADTTGAESVGVRASWAPSASSCATPREAVGSRVDGWDAAEEDRDVRARAAEAELGAVALALGGMGGDDWGEDETTPDSEADVRAAESRAAVRDFARGRSGGQGGTRGDGRGGGVRDASAGRQRNRVRAGDADASRPAVARDDRRGGTTSRRRGTRSEEKSGRRRSQAPRRRVIRGTTTGKRDEDEVTASRSVGARDDEGASTLSHRSGTRVLGSPTTREYRYEV